MMIYRGVMENYRLEDESLEYIYLRGVERRAMSHIALSSNAASSNVPNEPEFYHVKGDMMVFKVSEIKNISIEYKTVPKPPPPAEKTVSQKSATVA